MDVVKVGVLVAVVYQARKATTGLVIKMDVYDETQTLDTGKSASAMTEVGSTGRYTATFTPDAEGTWIAIVEESAGGKGPVVKAYNVVGHDVDSIGDGIVDVDTVVDAIKLKTDSLPSDPADQSEVEVYIDASELAIRGADSDTLETLSDQMDGVESPAMVG